MKLLVTGASGYVAKFVIEELEKAHELVLLSRRHPSQTGHGLKTKSRFIRGDLTNIENCQEATYGVETVVHLGANPSPGEQTFCNNTIGTYRLLEAARSNGVLRIVFASSNCVLGHCNRMTDRPFEARYFPFDEDHPSLIEDSYGLSKLVNEKTLETYTRAHGIDCVALRLNWCWGPREYERRKDESFNVARYAAGFWAYVDMRDVSQAFRLGVERPLSQPPSFGAHFISAADTMADQPSAELVARFYPQYQHLAERLEGHETFFSWQSAHEALGYSPQHRWRDQ